MTKKNNQINIKKKLGANNQILDSIKILSDFTRKDIEKSFNLEMVKDTEAYFSNRYGWTLRKVRD